MPEWGRVSAPWTPSAPIFDKKNRHLERATFGRRRCARCAAAATPPIVNCSQITPLASASLLLHSIYLYRHHFLIPVAVLPYVSQVLICMLAIILIALKMHMTAVGLKAIQ
jgi:hypothetical protein